MIKLKDLLTEGNKFDDVFKGYGFEVEKKSGGLTYWAHHGSDISGHKNSYIRGELLVGLMAKNLQLVMIEVDKVFQILKQWLSGLKRILR